MKVKTLPFQAQPVHGLPEPLKRSTQCPAGHRKVGGGQWLAHQDPADIAEAVRQSSVRPLQQKRMNERQSWLETPSHHSKVTAEDLHMVRSRRMRSHMYKYMQMHICK